MAPSVASALGGIALAGEEAAARSKPSLRAAHWSEHERKCLAEGIYFEARGESLRGQLAVGRVIMNRVASDTYPNTICGVVYQNAHKTNACQFSFACDGVPDAVNEHAKWDEVQGYAAWLLANETKAVPPALQVASLSASTHYHADYVNPYWADHMTLTGRIGRHYFYYDPAA